MSHDGTDQDRTADGESDERADDEPAASSSNELTEAAAEDDGTAPGDVTAASVAETEERDEPSRAGGDGPAFDATYTLDPTFADVPDRFAPGDLVVYESAGDAAEGRWIAAADGSFSPASDCR